MSLMSPVLAGMFFTTSATLEAYLSQHSRLKLACKFSFTIFIRFCYFRELCFPGIVGPSILSTAVIIYWRYCHWDFCHCRCIVLQDSITLDACYQRKDFFTLSQRFPNFLAPGTNFVKDNFSMDQEWGTGMFQDDSSTFYLLCTLFLM